MGYADTKSTKITNYNRLTRTREIKRIKTGKPIDAYTTKIQN